MCTTNFKPGASMTGIGDGDLVARALAVVMLRTVTSHDGLELRCKERLEVRYEAGSHQNFSVKRETGGHSFALRGPKDRVALAQPNLKA